MKMSALTLLVLASLILVAQPADAARACVATPVELCVANATLGALGACATGSLAITCGYVAYRDDSWCAIHSAGSENRLVCVRDIESDFGPLCRNEVPQPPCVGPATHGALGTCVHAADARCAYVSYRGAEGWCLLTEQDSRVVCAQDP